MKRSSYQNKWKSVGVKSGEYGGCGSTSYPKDLIFSWVCWAAVVENEGDYIFDVDI